MDNGSPLTLPRTMPTKSSKALMVAISWLSTELFGDSGFLYALKAMDYDPYSFLTEAPTR